MSAEMAAPAWLSDVFAAMMLTIAGYCAGRLIASRAWRRGTDLDADGVHAVMGVAMAGMLAPAIRFLPAGFWEAVFAAAAAWFAWQAARIWRGRGAGRSRCAFPVPHLAESLAMTYAFAAARPMTTGTGSAARFPLLAVVFVLFMVGYVTWLGDRLTSISPGAAVTTRPGRVDGLATAPAGPDLAGAYFPAAPAATGGCGQRARALPGPVREAAGCWPVLAPRSAACYKIIMGITMGYMLIIML